MSKKSADTLSVKSFNEITPEPMPTQFGPWTYDKRRRVLTHKDFSYYEVDLDKMNTAAAVLDWIMQIAGKNRESFGSPESLGWLVIAIKRIIAPQAKLCGGAYSRIKERRG